MEINEFKKRLKKVKLIVSDVDGTLLNKEYELSGKCLDMVRKLKDKNILFTLATQRIHSSIVSLARELAIEIPIITLNGALIQDVDGKNLLHRSLIQEKKVDKALQLAGKYYVRIALCYNDHIVFTEDNSVFKDFLGQIGVGYELVDSYDKYKSQTNHIFMTGNERESVLKIERKMRFFSYRHINVSRFRSQSQSSLYKLEIMPAKTTKKTGMTKLANYLGIKKDELVVIGDWYNDRELFDYGGLNVTLKHSIAELKHKAHYVSPYTNDEDGVCDFLKLFYDNLEK